MIREASALASVQHPNIVRVIGSFEQDNGSYIVMELLEGETLADHVRRNGPLPEQKAVGLVLVLSDAVSAMHSKGLLHQDIKPANIVLTNEGRVVLTDFGSAVHYGIPDEASRAAIVTEGYAPPEQYSRRGPLGPHSDVYGLAATLYYCLIGASPPEAVARIAEQADPRFDAIRLSGGTQVAISSAMELAISKRTPTADAFSRSLTRITPFVGQTMKQAGGNAHAPIDVPVLHRQPPAPSMPVAASNHVPQVVTKLAGHLAAPMTPEMIAAARSGNSGDTASAIGCAVLFLLPVAVVIFTFIWSSWGYAGIMSLFGVLLLRPVSSAFGGGQRGALGSILFGLAVFAGAVLVTGQRDLWAVSSAIVLCVSGTILVALMAFGRNREST